MQIDHGVFKKSWTHKGVRTVVYSKKGVTVSVMIINRIIIMTMMKGKPYETAVSDAVISD